MSNTKELHDKVKNILYSLTGITLTENKDIMITNRLDKLKRNTNFNGDLNSLLDDIKDGKHTTEFINTFTTNKTHFFREDFHFADLKNRVLPDFVKNNQEVKMYCSGSSKCSKTSAAMMMSSDSSLISDILSIKVTDQFL